MTRGNISAPAIDSEASKFLELFECDDDGLRKAIFYNGNR